MVIMFSKRIQSCLTAPWGELQGGKQREEKQEAVASSQEQQPTPEQHEPEPTKEAVRSPCAASQYLLLSAAAALRQYGHRM